MFGGWAHPASPPEDLTEKERSPPPEPTLLDFPSYTPHEPPRTLTSASCREFFRLLCTIRKPRDIPPEYLRPLNLNVTQNVSFQDLLPPTTDSSYHGPKASTPQNRLQQTIQELRITHTDAFREVVRLPPLPGRPRVRLSQTRKFWTGLEKMSQYWDCSMDQFYEISNSEDEEAEAESVYTSYSDTDVEMSNTDTHPTDPSGPNITKRTTKHVYKGRRIGTGSSMPPSHRDEAVSGLVETVVWAYNCQVRPPNLPPRLSVRTLLFPVRQSFIVGRVPREKELARRSVLEGPIMGICCRGETKFHEQSNGSGSGTGQAEGKIEDEVGDSKGTSWRETLDLAREIGVMLLLAQERARDGKEEIKPGEGKWWTTRPRWGGGPGGPVMEDDNDNILLSPSSLDGRPGKDVLPPATTSETTTTSDEEQPSTSARPKRKDRTSESNSADTASGGDAPESQPKKEKTSTTSTTSTSNKLTQAERWKLLRPGPGIWDRRMKYMRIGGEAAEDTIFMISALNHHVALLRLDVEGVWLDWLAGEGVARAKSESRQSMATEGEEESKSKQLQLKRTRWFDLFNEDDRVEFVEGLGDVVGWLMR